MSPLELQDGIARLGGAEDEILHFQSPVRPVHLANRDVVIRNGIAQEMIRNLQPRLPGHNSCNHKDAEQTSSHAQPATTALASDGGLS